MALMECRTAQDVLDRARRQREWRQQQYVAKQAPPPVPEPEAVKAEPAPFIPPAPILSPRMMTLDRLQRQARPRIKDAIELASKHYRVSVADIVSKRREAVVVRPRQVAMWLARTALKRSLPDIGRAIGGRDHTTVLSGIRKIERLRKTYYELDRTLNDLGQTLCPEMYSEMFWAD